MPQDFPAISLAELRMTVGNSNAGETDSGLLGLVLTASKSLSQAVTTNRSIKAARMGSFIYLFIGLKFEVQVKTYVSGRRKGHVFDPGLQGAAGHREGLRIKMWVLCPYSKITGHYRNLYIIERKSRQQTFRKRIAKSHFP